MMWLAASFGGAVALAPLPVPPGRPGRAGLVVRPAVGSGVAAARRVVPGAAPRESEGGRQQECGQGRGGVSYG